MSSRQPRHGEVDTELHVVLVEDGALRLQCEPSVLEEDVIPFWTQGNGDEFVPEDHPHPCRKCYPFKRKEPSETTKKLMAKFGHAPATCPSCKEEVPEVLKAGKCARCTRVDEDLSDVGDGIPCPDDGCEFIGKNKLSLGIHRAKAHGVKGTSRLPADGGKEYPCPDCEFVGKTKQSLGGHRHKHAKKTPPRQARKPDAEQVFRGNPAVAGDEDLVLSVTIPAAAAAVLNGETAKIEGLLQASANDLVREELEKHQTRVQTAIAEVAA